MIKWEIFLQKREILEFAINKDESSDILTSKRGRFL
jgi:hypothetical protein